MAKIEFAPIVIKKKTHTVLKKYCDERGLLLWSLVDTMVEDGMKKLKIKVK